MFPQPLSQQLQIATSYVFSFPSLGFQKVQPFNNKQDKIWIVIEVAKLRVNNLITQNSWLVFGIAREKGFFRLFLNTPAQHLQQALNRSCEAHPCSVTAGSFPVNTHDKWRDLFEQENIFSCFEVTNIMKVFCLQASFIFIVAGLSYYLTKKKTKTKQSIRQLAKIACILLSSKY